MTEQTQSQNLVQYNNDDGIEIFIDTTTGESFATKKGYSRMANVDKHVIDRRLKKGGAQNQVIYAKIPTKGGTQGGALLTEKLIADWLTYDNPELAKQFMTIGIRMGLHKLAGYNVQSDAVNQSQTQQPQLPTPEERLTMATNALERLGVDTLNPRFKQGYQDWAHNLLGIKDACLPDSSHSETRWLGAAERAEELGFGKVGSDPSSESLFRTISS